MKKRITALLLAAALMLTPLSVYAAAESARADETLYVNMDYFGTPTAQSVVKHICFGSEDSYTDFGDYTFVTNMSTGESLTPAGGKVTLKGEGLSSVYIEGGLKKDAVALPFNFDVTYSLNGVVTPPEDLKGASGLIGIDIAVTPEKGVSDYMRDNFILMAALPLTGEYYSVDAPGAQFAALGSYSAVIFEALPGAEAQFTLRLGTDSFEMSGLIFMMSPATVSDLKNVSDIKELNDKFRANTSAMLTDMEELMDTLSAMSEELNKTNLALSELKAGKDVLHENADDIFDANDAALSDIRLLADSLTPLDGSLKTMEWLIYDVNREMKELDQDLIAASYKMTALNTRLKSLGLALNGMDSVTETELNEALFEIISELSGISETLSQGSMSEEELNSSIESLKELSKLLSGMGLGSYFNDSEIAILMAAQKVINELADNLTDLVLALESLYSLQSLNVLTGEIASLSEDMEEISGYAGAVSFQTARLMTSMQNITGDLDSLIMTLDSYHEDIEGALVNADNTLLLTREAAADSADALGLLNDTLRAASAYLSSAADLSIEAGEGSIDKSLTMLDNVGELKESGQDLRVSVDTELDRLEEESNLLRMDPDAPMVSLTDTLNREPRSVSIICRTDEIRAQDDEARAILDIEEAEEKTTVFDRIGAVFGRIFSFIGALFS